MKGDFVYGVDLDKAITCNFSDLGIDSSHIFEDECTRMIYEAKEVFIDKQSHRELYVVDKGDEWRSYWVEDSYVIGANCCTIRSISDFLREKNKFFCGDIVAKYDVGVPTYYFVDAFTDVSGIFTVVFSYLDSDGKIAHCYSDKGMYRVLANWKIGTYGFAKDKFPLIVPFHKFNPDNIGGSLQHNVVKQQ